MHKLQMMIHKIEKTNDLTRVYLSALSTEFIHPVSTMMIVLSATGEKETIKGFLDNHLSEFQISIDLKKESIP